VGGRPPCRRGSAAEPQMRRSPEAPVVLHRPG
jgi:hypothetical protein